MSNELLPCPFCGSKARTYQFQYQHVADGYKSRFPWSVQCTNNDCIASGVGEMDEGDVIKKWNKRQVASELVATEAEVTQ